MAIAARYVSPLQEALEAQGAAVGQLEVRDFSQTLKSVHHVLEGFPNYNIRRATSLRRGGRGGDGVGELDLRRCQVFCFGEADRPSGQKTM